MRRKITLFVCLFFIASMAVNAGGFQVRLQGQKQTGIGLIGTPFAYGASSIFYNPGALSMMQSKYSFSLGASGIMSNHVFQKAGTDYTARTDNPLGTPFYFYGAGKVTDNLAIGVGVYTPFGSSAEWATNWVGQYLVQNISLQAIFYQPTISYKFSDKFSIGAGFIYATGGVELQKALPYNDNSTVKLDGNTTSMGFNVGAYFAPFEGFTFGVDYRSKIVMDVEGGDATFTVPAALSATIPENNKFDASLPMPANFDFGFSYQFTEKLKLAFEVNWVMWSIYDSLTFKFEEKGELLNSANPRLYQDSWITRLGAEYKLNDKFDFRCGVYYDPSPADEKYFTPETVTLNTLAWTLGMTFKPTKNLCIDLSYLQLHGMEAEKSYEPANFTGRYKTLTAIPGIGVNYSF